MPVASSSLLRAPHHTAAVVPVIETQHSSMAGQTSGLTAGRSGLSSSTIPAVRGGARSAAGPLRSSSLATPVAKPPSCLCNIVKHSKIILLPLTDTQPVSFWFLQTVFLQGIFACAEYQSKREDLEILLADWVAFFDKHSPRMVAYKAKYGKYIATTWSAAFLLSVQRFCTQMLGQFACKDLKRYQAEWFIEESFLTYTFISGDEIPGLLSPVLTPPRLISEGLVNYHQFVVNFELSVTGLDQDKLFPKEGIFISNLVNDVGPLKIGVHGFSPSKRLFDPSEDTLVDNMFINFEAKESEDENQPDNAQEEEVEEVEEDADNELGIEEEPSPHADNNVEFLGKAVKQPVPICSSELKYPSPPVPKPISSSAYTSIHKKGQSSHDKDLGFPWLEGGHLDMSLFGYNTVLARGGGKSQAGRSTNTLGTPYPETKGLRMITERFVAPGDFNDNKSNAAVATQSATLVEENLSLLRTEVLIWSFLTEFKIQASNIACHQAQLRNSASDPRSLLKGLIKDGAVIWVLPRINDAHKVGQGLPTFRITPGTVTQELIDPRSSILDHRSSIIDPRSSILDRRSSILDHQSSILVDP
ncbi:hypothetical protein BT96DRAFT_997608 [Gymnopus androsaceus JB14]|uniref:Uncharacterized protein n=1 Tax=Gymnopus androsaceus JB14 TaxID=1447944 RepID=A0A6A4HB48_9AGAR|nr:hypothetical protein BT96DRAFT_997608 [Gymnopus androsaceus JB14]